MHRAHRNTFVPCRTSTTTWRARGPAAPRRRAARGCPLSDFTAQEPHFSQKPTRASEGLRASHPTGQGGKLDVSCSITALCIHYRARFINKAVHTPMHTAGQQHRPRRSRRSAVGAFNKVLTIIGTTAVGTQESPQLTWSPLHAGEKEDRRVPSRSSRSCAAQSSSWLGS